MNLILYYEINIQIYNMIVFNYDNKTHIFLFTKYYIKLGMQNI